MADGNQGSASYRLCDPLLHFALACEEGDFFLSRFNDPLLAYAGLLSIEISISFSFIVALPSAILNLAFLATQN